MVEFIIHPKTREKFDINSKKGLQLINNYKQNLLKSGGALQNETNLTERLIEINNKVNKPKKVEDEIKLYKESIKNKKPLLLEYYHNTILRWPNNKEYQEVVKNDAILSAKMLLSNISKKESDNDSISESTNSILSF